MYGVIVVQYVRCISGSVCTVFSYVALFLGVRESCEYFRMIYECHVGSCFTFECKMIYVDGSSM